MYGDKLLVGKGLKLLFISQILSVISNFLGDGLLFGATGIAAVIVALAGLNTAAPAHPKFRAAFRLNIVMIVLYVVTGVLTVLPTAGQTVLLIAVTILTTALGAWNVYLICTAAGEFLILSGYATLAAKGVTVWKLFLVTSAATSVFMLLALVPILLVIAGILVIGTAIAMLVGAILYMIFLYNAYHALLYGR